MKLLLAMSLLCLSGCAKFAQGFAAGYNQSRQRHAQEDSVQTTNSLRSDGLGGYYTNDNKHCFSDGLGGFNCN
jgi:hypothetical protein